jgi:hypothetical protein
LFFFVSSFFDEERHSKGDEISFFSFLFAPQYTHKAYECSFVLCYNQIERKNGILRVRIDISGSLSGFEYCGENEECGTKSIVVIDACLEDESDSVVVDLLCD